MGDLYLHLGFARRARYANGLHPIAVEALVRASGAVVLGATLPHLPEVEHKGASFFRRLFMPGKQKRAFWMNALEPAGSPSLELALAVMTKGKTNQPGSMARFALGLGVLSHQVLHARVREVTGELEGAQRDATGRALARVWLQDALPSLDLLSAELKPALQLDDASANKALIDHLNAALREAHGEAPGNDTLWRWVRGLCADVEPLASRGVLPASAGISDEEARSKHGQALSSSVEEATRWFVFLVNRLAPLFLAGDPTREEMRAALVDEGDALRRPDGDADEGAAGRFHDAVIDVRREHGRRGRNPKSAFDEVSGASQKAPAGMPPVPSDGSGPGMRVPAHTQEVSVADIEAELRPPPQFEAPPHTQEVSLAQVEEMIGGAAPERAPASTQQVSLDDIQEELAAHTPQGAAPPPAPASTQQVSLDDIQEELATHAAAGAAGAPRAVPASTQQVSLDDIQEELAAQLASPAASPPPSAAAPVATPPPAAPPPVPPPAPPRDASAPFLAGSVPVPPPPPVAPPPPATPPAATAAPPSAPTPETTATMGSAPAPTTPAPTPLPTTTATMGSVPAPTPPAASPGSDADHGANGAANDAAPAPSSTTATPAEHPREPVKADAGGGSDPAGA